jgi:hypothetical protein
MRGEIGLQRAVLADPNAVLTGTFEAMLLKARTTQRWGILKQGLRPMGLLGVLPCH